MPSTTEEWLSLAQGFEETWQFPHAVGAIDWKHINLRAPPGTGSEFFNYKKHFSIVLLAIADARACFIAFELGAPGSKSDGGIFNDSLLSGFCNSAGFPKPGPLGDRNTGVPYYLMGDEAFALQENMMKPYPHRSAIGDEKSLQLSTLQGKTNHRERLRHNVRKVQDFTSYDGVES